MADYSSDHAGALADVTDAGSAVTFTATSGGTYNPATGLYASGSASTVAGFAIQTTGNPKEYEALGLVESDAPTLFFVPATLGDAPGLGDSVTWSGSGYRVRSMRPVAPNGTAIAWRVVVS